MIKQEELIKKVDNLEQEVQAIKRNFDSTIYVLNQQIEKLQQHSISIEKKLNVLLNFRSQK